MVSCFSLRAVLVFSLLVLVTTQSAAAGESGSSPHTGDSLTSVDGVQEVTEFERQTTTSEGNTRCEDCGWEGGIRFIVGILFMYVLGGFVVIAVVYSVFKFVQDIR